MIFEKNPDVTHAILIVVYELVMNISKIFKQLPLEQKSHAYMKQTAGNKYQPHQDNSS